MSEEKRGSAFKACVYVSQQQFLKWRERVTRNDDGKTMGIK